MNLGLTWTGFVEDKLFSDMNVLNEKECVARTTVNLEHYTGFVEMEALWCVLRPASSIASPV